MKKMTVLIAAALALSAPLAAHAMEHDHGAMKMDHGAGMMEKGKPASEKVVEGVKVTFKVLEMNAADLPKGMKETHHLMFEFRDGKSGKVLTEGKVMVKVQGPDKAEQVKDLMGMGGHFGADFNLSKKGEYGVGCKFKLADGKVRSVTFKYPVK
jgi:hypothetical protein